MGWPVCNATLENQTISEEPLAHIGGHEVNYHRLGLVVSAIFGIIAVCMSWYLIWRHCTHYLKPWEQKHIIRILFMVPIYAIVSFLSFMFYRHSVYFEVLRDCYEAFAIASFFALLCHYIAPDLHNQKDYFRGVRPKNWVLPVNWFQKCGGGENRGLLRKPRSGLTWFNVIYFGVFQYCFVRVFMTIVAVVTQALGRYCLESLNPAFAHIWVMVIEGCCVTIAMYCLIQFYVQLKEDLAEHRPLLKVTAIKLVIFLSFWQTILISFLTSSGAVKPSPRFDFPDIKIGIPSMLLCIEMAIFSVFHLWAFPWTVYDVRRSPIVAAESAAGFLPDPKTSYQGGKFGQIALMEAFNPWDLVKAVGRGFRWFAIGRRTREQDISYKSQNGVGLEPTRTNDTSYYRPSNSFEDTHHADSYAPPTTTANPPIGLGKPAHYRPLPNEHYDDEHNDRNHLLAHPQPNPSSSAIHLSAPSTKSYPSAGGGNTSTNASTDTLPYPRPMIRYPTPPPSKSPKPPHKQKQQLQQQQRLSGGPEGGGGGDIGQPGFYADEDPAVNPAQGTTTTTMQGHGANAPRAPSQGYAQAPSSSSHHDARSRDQSSTPSRIKTPEPAPAYLYSDPLDRPDDEDDRYDRRGGDGGAGTHAQHHREGKGTDWDMWGGTKR